MFTGVAPPRQHTMTAPFLCRARAGWSGGGHEISEHGGIASWSDGPSDESDLSDLSDLSDQPAPRPIAPLLPLPWYGWCGSCCYGRAGATQPTARRQWRLPPWVLLSLSAQVWVVRLAEMHG